MLCNEAVKQIVAFTQHIGQSDVKKELAIGDVVCNALLIVDEIGYLLLSHGGANLFFQPG